MTLMVASSLKTTHAKIGGTSYESFPFIYVFFQTHKTHNMLAMMLDSITMVWIGHSICWQG
jgi:hypothetical protein